MSIIKHFAKGNMCEVEFHLPQQAVKKRREVRVVGEFNDWSWEKGLPMRLENGVYIGKVLLPTNSTYQYRYLIDNQYWENDWDADEYVPADCGVENSVVDTAIDIVSQGFLHFRKSAIIVT